MGLLLNGLGEAWRLISCANGASGVEGLFTWEGMGWYGWTESSGMLCRRDFFAAYLFIVRDVLIEGLWQRGEAGKGQRGGIERWCMGICVALIV